MLLGMSFALLAALWATFPHDEKLSKSARFVFLVSLALRFPRPMLLARSLALAAAVLATFPQQCIKLSKRSGKTLILLTFLAIRLRTNVHLRQYMVGALPGNVPSRKEVGVKVFIGIKADSTGVHRERLHQLQRTWLPDAAELGVEVKLFTGASSSQLGQWVNGTVFGSDPRDEPLSSLFVNTTCSDGGGHGHFLCCKGQAMYRYFLDKYKPSVQSQGLAAKDAKKNDGFAPPPRTSAMSWFCSFDDDNYVLVHNLLAVLSSYNNATASRDIYIGRSPEVSGIPNGVYWRGVGHHVRFLTGGGGYCMPYELIERGRDFFTNFQRLCQAVRMPDDMMVGYINEYKLGVKMIVNDRFHSHLDKSIRTKLPTEEIHKQVSFGYDNKQKREEGSVPVFFPNVPVLYSNNEDPMLFRSLQSFLRNESSAPHPTAKR